MFVKACLSGEDFMQCQNGAQQFLMQVTVIGSMQAGTTSTQWTLRYKNTDCLSTWVRLDASSCSSTRLLKFQASPPTHSLNTAQPLKSYKAAWKNALFTRMAAGQTLHGKPCPGQQTCSFCCTNARPTSLVDIPTCSCLAQTGLW